MEEQSTNTGQKQKCGLRRDQCPVTAHCLRVTTKPDAVKNLLTWNITTTSISLSWEKTLGNASFYIQIIEVPFFNRTVYTTYNTIEGLTPGNYYTFVITAIVGENNTGNSSIISEYTRPASVTELRAFKMNNTMSISWLRPVGNRSVYLVEVLGDPPQNFTWTSESVTLSNLTTGIQYTVKIFAVAGNGLQGDSREISILVAENITATLITNHSIWLTWDSYVDENTSYHISVFGEPSSNLTVNTSEVQITNLTSGNLYTIKISAYKGDSILYGYGGEISLYTRPGIVRNIQIGNVSTNSMDLTWLPPESNYSYYLTEVIGDIYLNVTDISQSLHISGLTPGNQYTISIRAVTGTDVIGDSSTVLATTMPGNIKNLNVVNITDTSISLSWLPPDGSASAYLIQILQKSSYSVTTTSTAFTVENLIPGTSYTFLVSALAVDHIVQGNSTLIFYSTKPGKAMNLKTENVTTTSISLSWLPPVGYVQSYMVEILENATLNTNVTLTSVTIENLIPGNEYIFLVSSVTFENSIRGDGYYISEYTKPEVVKNLLTENITTTSISLAWGKPEGNASSYYIQILEIPSFNSSVITTSFKVEGLIPGYGYTFLVTAVVGVNITGNSSSIFEYTKPEVVKNLLTENITTTSISLGWSKPEGNASSFYIQILEISSFNSSVITTSTLVEGLIPGYGYTFLVTAVVGVNITGNSSSIFEYTKPEVVKNLLTGNITTTSISLGWSKPEGNASSYYIQILEIPSFNSSVITTNTKVEGLIPGYGYTFLVTAVVGVNITGNSSSIFEYTRVMPGYNKS
ncbi:receptor-type tyrosine-protein phosphatase eta-like [Engystomops pustulosus]|uniref:receptor-type tyrosine-protein phosphatase eta-like n=1 Tax=Engystomops pustulosus TaxID=76066 RepID=UPI003AFA33EA